MTTTTRALARSAISDALIEMVKHFESLHDGDRRTEELEPMLCPADVWTVGYGEVLTDPKTGRQFRGEADRAAALAEYRKRWPKGLFRAEAERRLVGALQARAAVVDRLVSVPLEPYQREALASFQYNTGALASSTLLKLLNAGDREGAARQFDAWNKATVGGRKKVLAGLVTRRAAEEAMFRGADWRSALVPTAMPQAVAPPAPTMKPPAQSRTIRAAQVGGGLAAAVGVIDAVAPAVDQVRDLMAKVQTMTGELPASTAPWVMVGVLAIAVGYMVWRRIDDHRQQVADA